MKFPCYYFDKQMVLSFRVTELQVLLGFAGKNKTGKKNELQARALELLRQRNTPIFMKIRELHKRYPASSNSNLDLNSGNSNHSEASDTGYANPSSPVKVSHYSMPHQSMMQVPMNLHPSSSQMGYRSSSSGKHSSMMTSGSGSSGFPVHPDVRFKALPFYDILAELLKPTSLCTSPNSPSRFQETNFVFHLTPQQANDVAMSRDVRPNIKNEYSVQIQLRFCLLETSCEQEDNFPPSICVKVNSKICPLPNPIPTNKPGVEPKRPSRPVNITNLCKLCPTVPNYVTVSWASEYGRAYVIGVYLVKRLNSSTLLQRLRGVGVRNPDHTKAMIKEKLQQDPDSEIATTSLRGSLMCPLGKMKMHIPCRAKTCNHLQCFDASLYLQMNEKKPTWICPVCDKPAIFKDLVIDGLFMEITTKAPSSCNEVQFHDDGNWTPVLAKKEPVSLSTSISGSSSKGGSSSSYSSPKRSSSSSQPEKKKQKVEVIDLTCDSSTDEYDDETDTSSPVAVYNTNSTTNSSQSNNNQFNNATTNNENSSSALPNIPASIQVISLPSPSSLSSCSNSSNSSHSSNNSTSTTYSTRSATGTTTTTSTPPVSTVTSLSVSVTRGVSPHSVLTTTTASISSSHPSGANRSLEGSSNSNQANSVSTPSVQGSSIAANPLYPNMPIIDGGSPSYYPPVSSPLHEFLNPMYSNYPSFDLYSMLQPNDADRQMPSYSTVPQSLTNRKAQGSAPDVISLD